MSKSQYSLYIKDTFNLTRSLVIKNRITAIAINNELIARGIAVAADETTWKYYLNLSGIPHVSDVPMTVTSIDTLETIEFNLYNLSQHRATAVEFNTKGAQYRELVNRYPEQTILIEGVINPVSQETVHSSPDWTIIHYDRGLVEEQETDLITKLQTWIYSIANRWLNTDYTLIEDLYAGSFIAVLFTQIPGSILDIRFGNCKTGRAHTFHIWSYLDNYHELAAFRNALSIQQALWLYRNIDTISAESYTAETFATLVDVLLTARGIPLYGYHLQHDPTLNPDSPVIELYRRPINYTGKEGFADATREASTILTDGKVLANANEDMLISEVVRTENAMRESPANRKPTKVVETDIRDTTNIDGVDLGNLLLMQWLDLADDTRLSQSAAEEGVSTMRYAARISVTDPVTDTNIRLDARDAWTLTLWLLATAQGKVLTTMPQVHDYVAIKRTIPTVTELRRFTKHNDVSDELLAHISNFPVPGVMVSAITFRQYVIDLRAFIIEQKFHIGNQENLNDHIALTLAVNFLYEPRSYQFDVITYNDWFTQRGMNFTSLSATDANIMALDIISKFTGDTGAKKLTTFQVQKAMLEIVKRLANYDIQYLQNNSEAPLALVNNKTFRIGDVTVQGSAEPNLLRAVTTILDTAQESYAFASVPNSDITSDFELRGKGVEHLDTSVSIGQVGTLYTSAIMKVPAFTIKVTEV